MQHVGWTVGVLASFAASCVASGGTTSRNSRESALAREVRDKGWIIYGALTTNGSMDLFLIRPDGSDQKRVTNTPRTHEGAPKFSPDGRRVLYRRISVKTNVHHNRWGYQGHVVLANADGSEPVAIGKDRELPWASWSPDGKKLSCLTRKGIEIVELATKKVVRRLPRKGIYQQLYWSPDGKWFCGVTSAMGEHWTVAAMNVETGEINSIRKFAEGGEHASSAYGPGSRGGAECTPDWFPDSKHILFSHHPSGPGGRGRTQLWMGDHDGTRSQLVYAESGKHIYGGTLSPDGKYVLFTRVLFDGMGGLVSGHSMGLMRFADAPTLGGKSVRLRKIHRNTKDGPVLTLPMGYEPDWTYADVFAK